MVEMQWSRDDQVATITIMRPKVRNALDFDTLEAVGQAFAAADAAGARVIVLRGDGPSFCAGADLRSYPGPHPDEADPVRAQSKINIGNQACNAVAATNAVTITVIQGHAIGGGLALALACDIRLVADDATLSLPELSLGLPLGWGGLYRIIAALGATGAWEMLTNGRVLTGGESVARGLCSQAGSARSLQPLLEDRLDRLLAIDAQTLILTKRQFRAVARCASTGDLEQLDGVLLMSALDGRRSKPSR